MEFSIFLLVAVQTLGALSFDLSHVMDRAVEICGREPADIVFVLDESSSIYPGNFTQQINFVRNVVEEYDIQKGNIKVGVMTFASDPMIRFHLGSVKDHATLNAELGKITQRTGNTFTADAINLVVSSMFGEHGRSGVVKVLILITDGESENTPRTEQAAIAARAQGIVIFAIGVGRNLRQELDLIATKPVDEYVHTVDSYKALEKISKALAYKTCIVTTPEPPTTTTTPTTTTLPNMIERCDGHKPLDVIFALSDNAVGSEVISSIHFINSIVGETKLAADRVQVGVTPRYCDYFYAIKLNEHDVLDSFSEQLSERLTTSPHTEEHIRYMYEEAIIPEAGGRENAVKIGVLIIDSASANKRETLQQAAAAKQSGMLLIVIAVGGDVNESEVETIASGADSLFRVESYADLGGLHHDIVRRLCRGLLENGTGDYDYYSG